MSNKKLTKGDDCIFGVCSGIADYIGWDPTFVRLLWVLLTILLEGGWGVILYIICAIVIPNKDE